MVAAHSEPNVWLRRIIKQGIEVTDRGRGEINSAYGGLGMIVGIVMPPIWGRLFAMGQTPATDAMRMGKGGVFVICAALMMMSWGVSKYTDPDTLFLEDREEKDDRPVSEPEPEPQGEEEEEQEEPASSKE